MSAPAYRAAFKPGVGRSPDLDRVLALARRPPLDLSSARARATVELVTRRLRRPDRPPGAACGCRAMGRGYCYEELLPAQAWALWEAPLAGGLLAPVGVGDGKTGLDVLMARAMPGVRCAVLLLPPGLVVQFEADYLAWAEHFTVPTLVLPDGRAVLREPGAPVLRVVPYSRFSREESTALLEEFAPDLVLADEVHRLKSAASVGTGRFLRYFAANLSTRLCGWSGTITSRSIKDFAHLLAFALGESSPLPLDPAEVESWASAVDPSDWPAPEGALRALREPGDGGVVEAVGRRVAWTFGVVSTASSDRVGASLAFSERAPPPTPPAVSEAVRELRRTWSRPDGEEFVQALEVAACARQLACGFFYRWRFPRGETAEQVEAWRLARAAWHRELRERMRDPAPGMDSPLLLSKAAIRWSAGDRGDLAWDSSAWPEWRELRDTVRPETEAVWVDDWLARDAAAWARESRGALWYEHGAFGRRAAELAGLPLHGGGPGAEERLRAEDGRRSCVLSIRAHGTGRDGLQRLFSRQLVANPPADAGVWEQLLGRLHRVGQAADVVQTLVYRHAREMRDAVDRALELAKYVRGIKGLPGESVKLLRADVEWDLRGALRA